ncbi:hypothetical protein Pla175_11850 [Pirellulimonas nuda]|uniref:Uncharacterized protein n=1 Tax=Pirellulimonas nuda TaxID=2528009 RepID=A0A518D8L5_9BACT|nr:hypothetical protein [Pirellulimonas nuda]QDU87818.1 hypothetical protein Pla175_11850 [Pirellulimonas nuda]
MVRRTELAVLDRWLASALLVVVTAAAPLGCGGDQQKFQMPTDPTPLPDPGDRIAPGGTPSTSRPMER